jgi:hypothetical protein
MMRYALSMKLFVIRKKQKTENRVQPLLNLLVPMRLIFGAPKPHSERLLNSQQILCA